MKSLEVALWTCGSAMLVFYAGAQGWSEWERQAAVESFAEARQLVDSPRPAGLQRARGDERPDIVPAAPALAPLPGHGVVIGVLRIPAIGLEVPVSYGTGPLALGRGAGVVEGTALPGEAGNVALAAHRDSHFRGLARLSPGDLIEVDSSEGTMAYRVTALSVVEPTDVHVLADTGEPVLTLVTCYPFHFLGNAPQRFIVRAVPDLPSA
ncbi:MAG: class D sortase [Chromatiales bacterium]|nr:class D sortase [Chromatiales bacterium]